MTQEERTLLHIDLSERVPYDTVLRVRGLVTSNEEFGDAYLDTVSWYEEVSVRDGSRISYDIADVRPYLRPLSSMTEEEQRALKEEQLKDEKLFAECLTKCKNGDGSMRGKVIPHFAADWCDKNHFDYRGLIPKGLALEAKEGMYKN